MNTHRIATLSPQNGFIHVLQMLLMSAFLILSSLAHADEFLDPEVAFKASARMAEPGVAEVTLTIADGYYLYREKLKFTSADAKIGDVVLPAGKVKV
jgi:thiol:disulfide interchange protein DsbD